jgi:hypothetical protein
MSRRKLQKYCNLTQAIKDYDPDLYNALDDLCLLPLLRPGLSGITFLFPEDKNIRKKIIDATYSKNPEMAVKMVKALILRGCYRKIIDLSGNVSNALNQFKNQNDIESEFIIFGQVVKNLVLGSNSSFSSFDLARAIVVRTFVMNVENSWVSSFDSASSHADKNVSLFPLSFTSSPEEAQNKTPFFWGS